MSRKTQIGWMSVGVLLCLFSVVLAMKLRDGNKALAREDDKRANFTQSPEPPTVPTVNPPSLPPKPPEAMPLPETTSPILRTGGTTVEPLPPVADDVKPEPKPVENSKPLPPIAFPDAPPSPSGPIVDRKLVEIEVKTPMGPPPNWAQPLPIAPPSPVVEVKPAPEPLKPLPPVVAETKPADAIPTRLPPMPASEVKKEVQPVSGLSKQEPGEPPMIVSSGPVQTYYVRAKTETLPDIARRTLGASERSSEILRLNPLLHADAVLAFGTSLKLPADACIAEEVDAIKPLPSLRPRTIAKPKVLPLTGTFTCNLDDNKNLTLPKAIREQLGNCETVLVSPGPDHCLWITNHAHLERLSERIEHSPAREVDVRVFKRLYYAQTEKAAVTSEGRIAVSDKLAQFAGLGQELVLVGIDEHFEVWDANRWKQYTQTKSAAARSLLTDE